MVFAAGGSPQFLMDSMAPLCSLLGGEQSFQEARGEDVVSSPLAWHNQSPLVLILANRETCSQLLPQGTTLLSRAEGLVLKLQDQMRAWVAKTRERGRGGCARRKQVRFYWVLLSTGLIRTPILLAILLFFY